MGFLVALAVGLVTGVVARLAFPDRGLVGGIYMSALFGVVGAVVAWLFGSALGWSRHGDGPGLASYALGALVVFTLYRVVARASGP